MPDTVDGSAAATMMQRGKWTVPKITATCVQVARRLVRIGYAMVGWFNSCCLFKVISLF